MVPAIPKIDSPVSGWDLPIRECGDPIERLDASDRIFVAPAYWARGFTTAPNEIRLRRSVIKALRSAAARLPPDVAFIVWDGLRSLATQAEIRDRFSESLRNLHLTDSDFQSMQDAFVSPLPRTKSHFERNPPPHTTGAAVELSLCDISGFPLEMGADFDRFDATAELGYFERADQFETLSDPARYHRRLLYWSMTGASFAPYGPEFWHFEYGTQRAASFYGRSTADFGPAVPWVDLEVIQCI